MAEWAQPVGTGPGRETGFSFCAFQPQSPAGWLTGKGTVLAPGRASEPRNPGPPGAEGGENSVAKGRAPLSHSSLRGIFRKEHGKKLGHGLRPAVHSSDL